jgi:glyoxylase-like metal-dependent hydrolase (beta-lactamase superfamily II)
MLTIQTFVVGQLQTNCYLISDSVTKEALVVDPADAPEFISDVLLRESLTPVGIIATHGHFDHILGAFGLQMTYMIPFYIHPLDTFLVERMQSSAKHFLKLKAVDPAPTKLTPLTDGQIIPVGKSSVKIIHVPGHTPGSVAVLVKEKSSLLVGDALFADGSVGRTDTSYGDRDKLTRSIAKMVEQKGITMLYPGHGDMLLTDRAKVMFGV